MKLTANGLAPSVAPLPSCIRAGQRRPRSGRIMVVERPKRAQLRASIEGLIITSVAASRQEGHLEIVEVENGARREVRALK